MAGAPGRSGAPGRFGPPQRVAAAGMAVMAAVIVVTLVVRDSDRSSNSADPANSVTSNSVATTSIPLDTTVGSSTTPVSTTGATTTIAAPTTAARSTATAPSSSTFASSVQTLDDATKAAMVGVTWREGCPVSLDDLRAVQVTYVGFDGRDHTGTLVVNASVTDQMISVFRRLYEVAFPIRKMIPIEAYSGEDDASTKDDNTSAFNCRTVSGSSTISQHAYGTAIDINPLENPYVRRDGTVLDPVAEQFLDRSLGAPGMIVRNDAVVKAFAAVGWGWGGNFSSTKDYQHFSANGR